MSITRYEELSDEAFIIATSLQLELPQRLVQFSHRAHDASKRTLDSPWADLAATSVSSSRGAHTVSHNHLVDLVCTIMTAAGVPTSRFMFPLLTISRERRATKAMYRLPHTRRACNYTFASGVLS